MKYSYEDIVRLENEAVRRAERINEREQETARKINEDFHNGSHHRNPAPPPPRPKPAPPKQEKDDTLLLLILIFVLYKDVTDNMLMLALFYIMM